MTLLLSCLVREHLLFDKITGTCSISHLRYNSPEYMKKGNLEPNHLVQSYGLVMNPDIRHLKNHKSFQEQMILSNMILKQVNA